MLLVRWSIGPSVHGVSWKVQNHTLPLLPSRSNATTRPVVVKAGVMTMTKMIRTIRHSGQATLNEALSDGLSIRWSVVHAQAEQMNKKGELIFVAHELYNCAHATHTHTHTLTFRSYRLKDGQIEEQKDRPTQQVLGSLPCFLSLEFTIMQAG